MLSRHDDVLIIRQDEHPLAGGPVYLLSAGHDPVHAQIPERRGQPLAGAHGQKAVPLLRRGVGRLLHALQLPLYLIQVVGALGLAPGGHGLVLGAHILDLCQLQSAVLLGLGQGISGNIRMHMDLERLVVLTDDQAVADGAEIGPQGLNRGVFPLAHDEHRVKGESDLLLRHPQPQGGGAACAPGPLCRLLRGQTAAGPRVDHLSILPVGSTGGMELRPGTEAGVDQPLGLQSPQSSLIQRRPPALLIGAAGAADDRSLVPVQSQPPDVPAHLLPIAPRASRDIQILDPQDHSPALLPGAEPSQQAAQNIPQMDAPAWRRRKPSGHRHGLLPSLSVHATPL